MSSARIEQRRGRIVIGNSKIQASIDAKTKTIDIAVPGEAGPAIRSARAYVCCRLGDRPACADAFPERSEIRETAFKDAHGRGRRLELRGESSINGILLSYIVKCYESRPFLLVRCVVSNRSDGDINIDEMALLHASPRTGGALHIGGEREALRLFKVGWHDWCYTGLRLPGQREVRTRISRFVGQMYFNPSTPKPWARGRFWSEGWGILAGRNRALVAGFVSTADQFGQIYADGSSRSPECKLVAKGDGVVLSPGEDFASEWGYAELVDLPCAEPAAEYAEATARQMNARVPKNPPPAKWTHWYHYFHNITETLFMENLSVIDRIRDSIPFKTVQLDDGYQSAWGDWYVCNEKFPNGLKKLATEISSRGYTPGLWLAPFVVDPKSKMASEHPDWLVLDKKGKPINSGYFWDFFGHSLDTTNPAVLDWVRTLMRTVVREWGFSFVKTDFVYAAALPGIRHNPRLTRAQAFRLGMEAVRDGIGKDTLLLGCGCPSGPAIGIVDTMRVGPDTAPSWNPFIWNMKWATPILKSETGLAALRNNIRQTINLSVIHERWWWSDPDCLMVRDFDTKLTEDEIRSNVSLMGLMGWLGINSDDLTRLTPERRRLVSILLPIFSSGGYPLDLLEREMAEIYHLPMKRGFGEWHNLALFNWGERAGRRSIELSRLGLKPDAQYHVYDFWLDEYRLHRGPRLETGVLPSHGCALLRISAHDGKPRVVGSSLHITQGGEIERVTAGKNSVKIVLKDLGRRAQGKLLVWLPGGRASAAIGKKRCEISERGKGVWAVELEYSKKTELIVGWGR